MRVPSNKCNKKYYSLYQGYKTIKEYETELNRLMRFLPKPLKASDDAKISKFVKRLKA